MLGRLIALVLVIVFGLYMTYVSDQTKCEPGFAKAQGATRSETICVRVE